MTVLRKILFVDDDIPFVGLEDYLAAVRRNFEVVCVERAVDVGPALAKHHDVCAIVLDMMMAVPPAVDPRSVDGGQYTGLWVLRENRRAIDGRRIRVVVLTQKLPRDIHRLMREDALHLPMGELVRVHRKLETKAPELPILVKRFLDEIGGADLAEPPR